MKKTLLGIYDFILLKTLNNFYADTTEFLYKIAREPRPCFLSIPDGFGKTSLVDALERLIEGRREPFEGPWLDGSDRTPRPAIRLEWAGSATSSRPGGPGRRLDGYS